MSEHSHFEVDPEAAVEEEEVNPFDPMLAPGFTLITLMRLYDVQMALLNEVDHEAASRLNEMHAQGKVIGSFPWITGNQ
jgi:hypothetical protein